MAVLAIGMLLAGTARANDDQLIFGEFTNIVYGTRMYNNGWSDWSWVPVFATNNPVHSGSISLCLAPSGPWQALKFVHEPIDTTLYTDLTFWINGGATGGQRVQFKASLGGTDQVGVEVGPAPTNSWKKVVIPLDVLGIANKTNFDGLLFWVAFDSPQPPVYLDDMALTAAQPPATVHVSVDATQTVRTVFARVLGVNMAAWDGNLDTATTIELLNDLGNPCLRWPGGSWGDVYHWTDEHHLDGDGYRGWGSFSSDFINVATNTHAQAFIIVNYGTGTPEEAAYGVRMFNVTNYCNFTYWEVGNENFGSWEADNNTNAPYKAHDPWTYAMRFKEYYTQMKAEDPDIKVGAVLLGSEDASANYNDHPAINPRTGESHNGWDAVMLATMRTNNVMPDFVVVHKYAPNIGDTGDLLWSSTWAGDAARIRRILNDYLGDAATNVTLECTEYGAGGDRQSVSLVGGLFLADSLGQVLQTEFDSRLKWDLRNGQSALPNPDPALYGWRNYYDEGIVYGAGNVDNRYPSFYINKLMTRFVAGGDTVVSASSDYPLLAVYAVRRANGLLSLLVINKSSYASLDATIDLSGFQPFSEATVYSYGIPQDEAARTNGPALLQDLDTNSLFSAATHFSHTFPPYSATVLSLAPDRSTLVVMPSASDQFVFQLQGQAGAYRIQRSDDLASWTTVSTNALDDAVLDLTNSVFYDINFYRAVWEP